MKLILIAFFQKMGEKKEHLLLSDYASNELTRLTDKKFFRPLFSGDTYIQTISRKNSG